MGESLSGMWFREGRSGGKRSVIPELVAAGSGE